MLGQLHSETGDVEEGSKVWRNTQCLLTQTQLEKGGREEGRKILESFTKGLVGISLYHTHTNTPTPHPRPHPHPPTHNSQCCLPTLWCVPPSHPQLAGSLQTSHPKLPPREEWGRSETAQLGPAAREPTTTIQRLS